MPPIEQTQGENVASQQGEVTPAQPDAGANAGQANTEGKPGEPPAQAGDVVETKVAEAVPQVLQSLEQGKKELDENPARTSTLTNAGHLVREG